MTDAERRLKSFTILPEQLADLVIRKQPYPVLMKEGLPPDAALVRCGYDVQTDMFYVILRHETFDVVKEGGVIPKANVTFTQFVPGATGGSR